MPGDQVQGEHRLQSLEVPFSAACYGPRLEEAYEALGGHKRDVPRAVGAEFGVQPEVASFHLEAWVEPQRALVFREAPATLASSPQVRAPKTLQGGDQMDQSPFRHE